MNPETLQQAAEAIIKKHIPHGIQNIKGKGDGKAQYQAEIAVIKKCMEDYAALWQSGQAGCAVWVNAAGGKPEPHKLIPLKVNDHYCVGKYYPANSHRYITYEHFSINNDHRHFYSENFHQIFWLDESTLTHSQRKGTGWVKAIERLPEVLSEVVVKANGSKYVARIYDEAKVDMVPKVSFFFNGRHHFESEYSSIFWLDESLTQSEQVKEVKLLTTIHSIQENLIMGNIKEAHRLTTEALNHNK